MIPQTSLPKSWCVLLEDPIAAERCYIRHVETFHWQTSEHRKQFHNRLENVLESLADRVGKISTTVFENEILGHLGPLRREPLNTSVTTLSPEQIEERKREEFETEIYEQKSYRSVPRTDD